MTANTVSRASVGGLFGVNERHFDDRNGQGQDQRSVRFTDAVCDDVGMVDGGENGAEHDDDHDDGRADAPKRQ